MSSARTPKSWPAGRQYIHIETRPRLSISDPFFPYVTQRRLVQILDVDPVVRGISAPVAKRQAMPLADRAAHPAVSSKTRELRATLKGSARGSGSAVSETVRVET